MYEHLYDINKATNFVNRKGTDKTQDWISSSISLKNIGVEDVEKLTISDLYGILEDLESLCDEDVELSLQNINDSHCTTLTLKNPAHYEDEWIYEKISLDPNIKENMSTILNACKNWTINHKNETLELTYNSVEQLYDVLIELDDILNRSKVND